MVPVARFAVPEKIFGITFFFVFSTAAQPETLHLLPSAQHLRAGLSPAVRVLACRKNEIRT